MFTGIVENVGVVKNIKPIDENIEFTVFSTLTSELKIDQSVSHNGVCLTVVELDLEGSTYKVVAIKETLLKTNMRKLKVNDSLNLELAMRMNERLDGHIVQGHVDAVAECISIKEEGGSWLFSFRHQADPAQLINKGSIAINGTSLTIVEALDQTFSVAIIPYTYEHTTFKYLKEGDEVNIEFDIVGKYVLKSLQSFKTRL